MADPDRSSLARDLAVSALVAIPLGLFGFVFLFSDVSYGLGGMLAWHAIHFLLPGVIVGLIVPKRWLLAVLVAWPVLVAPAFGIFGKWVNRDVPVVQAVIAEGSLFVSPREFPRRFRLFVRNDGSDVHELGLAQIDESADLTAVAANPPVAFTMRPLRARETDESSFSITAGTYAFLCIRAGHALRGEIGRVSVR